MKFKGAEVRKEFGCLGTFTGYIREIWEHKNWGIWLMSELKTGTEDISLGEMNRILVNWMRNLKWKMLY